MKSLRMKTTTNKHVCRPPNESPTRPRHQDTSPKAAAQTSYTNPETSATRCHITCTMGCGYVLIVQCLTTLDIKLNATSARTETTAHLDGDLHRHGTRTVNLVHDCQRNVHDKKFTTLLLCSCSCVPTAKWLLDIWSEHTREEDEHEVVACS